ncbi:NAD(P)/FAD-dependent oxidoreductase [Leucobacter zeae]|nr:NAD(P)/FAD-dependent oxidoreductase [Leucobacter zeae]
MTDTYDLIVLGAGPVGENVADRAVRGGLTALIVERELVGGECSYWACMPSKALLRSGQALRAARAVPGSAEAVSGELDVAAVLARRDAFASDWDDAGQADWLRGAGVDLVRGHGRVDGERRVVVTDADGRERVLHARHAVAICTGSDAAIPPVPGLRAAEPWTSREATSAREVPESLAVIGGGVVAVELATAFAALGSRVAVLARSGLLGGFESFAGEAVADGLRALGVDVRLGSDIRGVERDASGVTVRTADGDVRASEVLVATGRIPRSAGIGLESIGIGPGGDGGTDRGAPASEFAPGRPIPTDDTLRVPGTDWLYAVGDVAGRAPLTHQGKYEARAAGDIIAARASGGPVDDAAWGRHAASADRAAVPQVVFSSPEVAAVGLTERAARESGRTVRVADAAFSSVAGASLHADGYRGRGRIVIDAERDVLLGATLVGEDVAELIHAATVAVVGEVPLARLWHAVPAYPTMSEVWLRLLEADGRDSA